jgi:bifunctional non-homologous end joining protein LigD
VSVPLTWDELSPAIKPNHFTVENLPARLERLRKDPWAALSTIKQTLPTSSGRVPASRKTRARD